MKRRGGFSSRTKYEAWVRCNGLCEHPKCGRPIKPGRPEYDHIKPKALGGDDSLENCQVLCIDCHKHKTHDEDRPPIARATARRKTDLNLRNESSGRAMPGTKRSGIKIHMDRTVSYRTARTYPAPDGWENLSGKKPPTAFKTLTDGEVLVRILMSVHPEVLQALNNSAHMQYSEQRHRDHTVTSQRLYLDQMATDGHLPLGIFIKADNGEFTVLVGTMGCTTDDCNKILDIGLMILPKFARKGYGLRAWRLVQEWALHDGQFAKVEAGHHEKNAAMMTICDRAGMVMEGHRLYHFLDDNGVRSNLVQWGKWL